MVKTQPRTNKILLKMLKSETKLRQKNKDADFVLTRKSAERFFPKVTKPKVHFNDTVMRTVRYLYETNRLDRVSRGKYKISNYGRVLMNIQY